VLPVVERVAALGRAPGGAGGVVSIDTTLAAVAEAALDAGAAVINDISAGRDDPRILAVAAARGVPIVLMHMQGTPETMQVRPSYTDVVAEVEAFLRERIATAIAAGVRREQIVIDPGIGFGKTREHNLALLGNLGRLTALGFPVLLGSSRKRFMGSICRVGEGETSRPPESHGLVGATCATTALGVAAGVRMFRVHDVRENRQAADVAWAIVDKGVGRSPR
jgi:dihydropteroate synthase